MTKKRSIKPLRSVSGLQSASLLSRFQARSVIRAAEIKHRLRLAGVSDSRITEIIEEASKKAATTIHPFLYWLDVLAEQEVAKQCQTDNK